MLELDGSAEFDPARAEPFFAAMPSRPGVLLLELKAAGAEPHLVRTADLRRASERLLRTPEAASKRLNLRDVVRSVRFRVTGSKLEQSLALYQHAKCHFPRRYRERLRLRPPALIKVNLANEYPRAYVTRRILADQAFYLGPFRSRRAAQAFLEEFLNLFKIRRCQIKIRRDPSFPGCLYSEMKMCLAPCFAGCTKPDYDVEVGRVVRSLAGSGAALTEELERARAAASEALDFERAAALHKRLDKVAGILSGLPDVARPLGELNALILERGAAEQSIAAFVVRNAALEDPLFIRFDEWTAEPRSVEQMFRQFLGEPRRAGEFVDGNRDAPSVSGASAADLSDSLALISRWFYSSPREGEILFAARDWPYRRILRACARLLQPDQTGKGK